MKTFVIFENRLWWLGLHFDRFCTGKSAPKEVWLQYGALKIQG